MSTPAAQGSYIGQTWHSHGEDWIWTGHRWIPADVTVTRRGLPPDLELLAEADCDANHEQDL